MDDPFKYRCIPQQELKRRRANAAKTGVASNGDDSSSSDDPRPSYTTEKNPNLSRESPTALETKLGKLNRDLTTISEELKIGVLFDIELCTKMIAARNAMKLRLKEGEILTAIEGNGLCVFKSASHAVSSKNNYDTFTSENYFIGVTVATLRQVETDSTQPWLRGTGLALSRAAQLEANPEDYAGRDILEFHAMSVGAMKEIELRHENGTIDILCPSTSAAILGLLIHTVGVIERIVFACFVTGCHHIDCITTAPARRGAAQNGSETGGAKRSVNKKPRAKNKNKFDAGSKNGFHVFHSDDDSDNDDERYEAMSAHDTGAAGLAPATADASADKDRLVWRALRLVSGTGECVELRNCARSTLGSVYLPSATIDRSVLLEEHSIVSRLAVALEASEINISLLATRKLNNQPTEQQAKMNTIMSHIVPKLSRIVGLGLRGGKSDGGIIQYLAVTVDDMAAVYEPEGNLGLLATFRRTSIITPLYNPHIGRDAVLANALSLKQPPKQRKILEAAKKLRDALENLPQGFSYVMVMQPGDSSSWRADFDLPATYTPTDGVCILSRGDIFCDFALRYTSLVAEHVSVTNATYLLGIMLHLEPDLNVNMFLCSLSANVLDVVLSTYRDELHASTSSSRLEGLSRDRFVSVARAVYDSIFREPPVKNQCAGGRNKHKHDRNYCGVQNMDDASENDFDACTPDVPLVQVVPVMRNFDSALDSMTQPSQLPGNVATLYVEYHKIATQNAVCIKRCEIQDLSGSTVLTALIALPSYTRRELTVTKGTPALVTVTCVSSDDEAGDIHPTFECDCPLDRIAKFSPSPSVRGAEGRMCWHQRSLRNPFVFRNVLLQRVSASGRDQENPSNTEVLLNRPQGYMHDRPKHAYVYVSLAVDHSFLGNSKDAIVTISFGRMRCGRVCQGGRRLEAPAKGIRSSCEHIKHILSVIIHPVSADRVCIREVFEGPSDVKTSATYNASPAFNIKTQQFDFRSLSLDIDGRSVVPVEPMEPINVNSPLQSSYMGGENDLDQVRLRTLLAARLYPDDPAKALADNGLATRGCKDCRLHMSTVLDNTLTECCSNCASPGKYRCDACFAYMCSSCCVVNVNAQFYAVFSTYVSPPGHVPGSFVVFEPTKIREIMHIVEQEHIDEASLCLKPRLPVSHSCTFHKENYFSAGSSVLYLPTHTREVDIFNLLCDNDCCTIEPTGSEIRCHRQSKETMIHLDVIHLFHHSMRNMRGPGITAFAGLMNELYKANGAGKFMGPDLFARCYYGAKCRELRGKPLGRPCFTCPKRLINGKWATGCNIIAVDAKMDIKLPRHLLDKRTAPAPDISLPQAPVVNCKKRSHLDRLFFPGNSKTLNSTFRMFISAVCKSILLGDAKVDKDERALLQDHAGVFLQFEGAKSNSGYLGSFGILYRCFKCPASERRLSVLESLLARWFLAITNTQCPMDQFMSPKACTFVDECLQLSVDGMLSLTVTRRAEQDGVRRQLVRLIEAAFVHNAGLDQGPSLSVALISMQDDVFRMLRTMTEAARAEYLKTESQEALPDLKTPLPSDYSSGIAMFVTKGGGILRMYPKFTNIGKSGRSEGPTCTKPSWHQADCKKWQWSSDGNVTFMCVKSGCCLGTFFLDSAEGRSSATAALYSYFPNWDEDMTVIGDTPCMHSIYGSNRLPRHFRRTQWICDRFHLPPHTCKLIFNPDEFQFLDGLNLSLIEQWHAIVDGLSVSVQRMNLDHAMFFILLLQHDRYDELADQAGISAAERCWPEDVVDVEPLEVPGDLSAQGIADGGGGIRMDAGAFSDDDDENDDDGSGTADDFIVPHDDAHEFDGEVSDDSRENDF